MIPVQVLETELQKLCDFVESRRNHVKHLATQRHTIEGMDDYVQERCKLMGMEVMLSKLQHGINKLKEEIVIHEPNNY